MSRRILYLGQWIALAFAGAAITTNALTWLNIALTPVAVLCFLFVFPLFLGGLISYLIKASPSWGGTGRVGTKAWVVQSQTAGTEIWDRIQAGIPHWQLIGLYSFVAYVFINFFGTFAVTSGKPGEPMDPALQVRLMTGHAALFLLVSAGLLRAARRLAKDTT